MSIKFSMQASRLGCHVVAGYLDATSCTQKYQWTKMYPQINFGVPLLKKQGFESSNKMVELYTPGLCSRCTEIKVIPKSPLNKKRMDVKQHDHPLWLGVQQWDALLSLPACQRLKAASIFQTKDSSRLLSQKSAFCTVGATYSSSIPIGHSDSQSILSTHLQLFLEDLDLTQLQFGLDPKFWTLNVGLNIRMNRADSSSLGMIERCRTEPRTGRGKN